MYHKPTLFRADVWEIAHGLIIRTIRYSYPATNNCLSTLWLLQEKGGFRTNLKHELYVIGRNVRHFLEHHSEKNALIASGLGTRLTTKPTAGVATVASSRECEGLSTRQIAVALAPTAR